MPVITDPGEPYFKDGIWGWDATADLWLPLAVDPATNYLIVNARGDIEVHQHTPADLTTANHGWDGAAWHRLPMLWGYSDTYYEWVEDLTPAAGTIIKLGTQVPAGEVWVITTMAATDETSAITSTHLCTHHAGVYYRHHVLTGPAANAYAHFSGHIYLEEDNRLAVVFYGVVAGDDLQIYFHGYKMLIAE